KLVIHSYRYGLEQFLESTGNSLNIGFNQLRSNTPLKVMGSVILSSCDTVTELLTVRLDKEFEQITAYSRAQIDVSQSFVLSKHKVTYQKCPQADENPSQNMRNGADAVLVLLKLVIYRQNSISVFPLLLVLIELSKIPKVLAGIVMVQLTQHFQTQQQVAELLAPSGALAYLVPLENDVFTGWSMNSYFDRWNDYGSIVGVRITSLRAAYEETQSECDAFVSRDKQSYALKLILLKKQLLKLLQMGFWSGLKNFGSKILHDVTSAAKWVTPVLYKVIILLVLMKKNNRSLLNKLKKSIKQTVNQIRQSIT
ncbi:MAG: hypothetical protein EZS28_046704, partial [Streblomastix strix]